MSIGMLALTIHFSKEIHAKIYLQQQVEKEKSGNTYTNTELESQMKKVLTKSQIYLKVF